MTYRSLAAKHRSKERVYHYRDCDIFLAVIFELAHALSRGRRPSSSCLLHGVNLREWLQEAYTLDYYRGHRTLVDVERDALHDRAIFESVLPQKALHAIELVEKKLVYPSKLGIELRGDPAYQRANKSTNLKRKQSYGERRQESAEEELRHLWGSEFSYMNP